MADKYSVASDNLAISTSIFSGEKLSRWLLLTLIFSSTHHIASVLDFVHLMTSPSTL